APALPRLLALHDGDSLATGSASAALIALGPFAVPELVKRLHSTNIATRRRAAGTLAYIGLDGEPAIPTLLVLLNDSDALVRQYAVVALAGIGQQPERLMPLFRDLLGDSNSMIRAYAAFGLQRFGAAAKETVPDLLRAANDSEPNVSNSVRRALKQIEPPAIK